MELDATDKDIINLLVENSKLSYRDIAKNVKISAATALNRIKRLEKDGIIDKFTIKIDHEKMGYDLGIMIEVRISKGKQLDVEKKIISHPNVLSVYDLTGDFDAVIFARFKHRRSMDTFIKKIQTYDFIERTNTRLILNVIKKKEVYLS
tara:strand:- start:42 stop:488 length:447 start_codon:yes stop_codon:yes gene_type:complete